MIGDFNRYLMQSAEWRQLRSRHNDRRGYDIIFVDEFHYFNKTEVAVFHSLFTLEHHPAGKMLPLFMAYDLKQSPTDAGINASNLFKATGAGETKLVELSQVFRSSPAISRFLADLDGSFPAYQLSDDWKDYPQESNAAKADVADIPTLRSFGRNIELLDEVFSAAAQEAAKIGGRQVAVLCLNDELFEAYLKAGRIKDMYVPVVSRDDIGELRYVRRKFVFSMPQHISGLQFDSVYLINVDREDMPADATNNERRRFITRCYVAASRAIRRLQISSSEERGGGSEVLSIALTRGSLNRLST